MGAYYPSCAVNLRIRFDEAMHVSLPAGESVDFLTKFSVSNTGQPFTPPVGASNVLQPLLLSGQKDRLSQILGLIPKTLDAEANGYRQASKFSMTLPWRDFPIDPRIIRSIGVEIYMDCVTDQDFARGIANPTQGRRVSIVEPSQDNQLFIGTADEISTEWTDKGIMVHMEGRSLVGILCDLSFSPTALSALKHNETISDVVRQILTFHPLGFDIPITVVSDDFGSDGEPVLADPSDLTRVNMGADGNTPKVNVQGDPNKLSFWDIITQYCFLVGVIPYFVGETLHLRPARKLFELEQSEMSFDPVGGKTPFAGGTPRFVATGIGPERRTEQFKFRRMSYDRNIQSLKFDRKLGGVKPPTVICYSSDTSSKIGRGPLNKIVTAQWPMAAPGSTDTQKIQKQKVTTVAPSGETTQSEVIRIPVPGFNSKSRLQEIAHQFYEEISRQEVGGSCATKDLASFGGDNNDPDLLRMRPGDAIEFRIPAAATVPPIVNQVTSLNAMGFEQAVAIVAARLGDSDLARVIVATARDAIPEMQRIFRVGNIKFAWNVETGIAISFDFQNYIEARNDVESS